MGHNSHYDEEGKDEFLEFFDELFSLGDDDKHESEAEERVAAVSMITDAYQLRKALATGIVSLADTDNDGVIRHVFLTANRSFIARNNGDAEPLPPQEKTVVHAMNIVRGEPMIIQPDLFTGKAVVVAALTPPVSSENTKQIDGFLMLDEKVGAFFLMERPLKEAPDTMCLPCVGDYRDGRLHSLHPYTLSPQNAAEHDNEPGL